MNLFESNYLAYSEAIKISAKPGYKSDWEDLNEILYELRYTTNDGQPCDLESYGFSSVLSQEYDESSNQYVVKLNLNIIENELFSSCSSVTSMVIGNGIINIGDYAFYGCINLTSVTIPNSVTRIGRLAFERCGFTSLIIPNSVTDIDIAAFWGCNMLNSIEIPNSVTSIGDTAFSGVNTVIYSGTATGSPWGANQVITENN